MTVLIDRLAVIGVGLIGGSLARALRLAGQVGEVIGCGRGQGNLERARELGVIDAWTQDPAEAARDADLVFISVPLGSMRSIFEQIAPVLGQEAVVTDGGSVKGSVIADAAQVFGGVPAWFVAGHPIAGTERSGVEASFDSLYRNRRVILTPTGATDAAALDKVTRMWQACGAQVCQMSAAHHDEVLAATSHLPHMLAYGLVEYLASLDTQSEIFQYAAGGFRDFTRIASSNPAMWRDICMANQQPLHLMLKGFAARLDALAEILEQGRSDQLLSCFETAKVTRDAYVDGVVTQYNQE